MESNALRNDYYLVGARALLGYDQARTKEQQQANEEQSERPVEASLRFYYSPQYPQ